MSKLYFDWKEIQRLSDKLAQAIAADCTDLEQATLVAVSRGGLVPAQLVAYRLNIRDVRVMKLISYDVENKRGEIKDISTDRLFDGGDVYFIDDLADSGETVKYIRKKFPSSRICSLLMKTCCETKPDICACDTVDAEAWLVFPWD